MSRRPGRPRKDYSLEALEAKVGLTLPEGMAWLRLMGYPVGRIRLNRAIATGQLRVHDDTTRLSPSGGPVLRLLLPDLKAWLRSALQPHKPKTMPLRAAR